MMDNHKEFYKAAILTAQRQYADIIGGGEVESDSIRNEYALIKRVAEEGLRFPELWEQTAVYIHTIFGAVERWGEWSEWLPILEAGRGMLTDKPHSLLRIIHWLGHVYYLHRNFEDALIVLTNGLAVAKEADPKFAALIQQRLCNIYLEMDEITSAKLAADEALAYCHQLDRDDALRASVHNSIGLVAMQMGEVEEAVGHYKTAVSIWKKQSLLTQLSRTETNLGVAYFQLAQFDDATLYFERALAHLEQLDSPVDKLKTINNLASIYYMQAAYEQAEKILVKAISESRQLVGIYHVRGSLSHNLGNTLVALKRFGEAEVHLNNSLYLWQMVNDEIEAANTHDTLGEMFQAQQDFEQAIAHYQQAVNLAKNHPHNPTAVNLLHHCEKEIGVCCQALLGQARLGHS